MARIKCLSLESMSYVNRIYSILFFLLVELFPIEKLKRAVNLCEIKFPDEVYISIHARERNIQIVKTKAITFCKQFKFKVFTNT